MCSRVFSLRFLQSHVESCLISSEAAETTKLNGSHSRKGQNHMVDLTDPESVPLDYALRCVEFLLMSPCFEFLLMSQCPPLLHA
jgi:hypothetical protein